VQEWLDNAVEGFILFSLGTNVKSSKLPQERIASIINVFSKLKFKVLWKFEREDLPGRPPNVKISKWLSQQDVLGIINLAIFSKITILMWWSGHKNIRAFITHGGRLSIQESIYHGVPTFVIPFFADQYLNGEQMVTSGVGLRMNYAEFDITTFEKHIHNLIQNNKQYVTMRTIYSIIHYLFFSIGLRQTPRKYQQLPKINLKVLCSAQFSGLNTLSGTKERNISGHLASI
jgi:glucuronosyltransferase